MQEEQPEKQYGVILYISSGASCVSSFFFATCNPHTLGNDTHTCAHPGACAHKKKRKFSSMR